MPAPLADNSFLPSHLQTVLLDSSDISHLESHFQEVINPNVIFLVKLRGTEMPRVGRFAASWFSAKDKNGQIGKIYLEVYIVFIIAVKNSHFLKV